MASSISSSTAAAASAASVPITNTGTSALGSLSNNFNNFLQLLMTQLQHQDPSSPMDANQFTSQLVQFSSVEQQISTNTNLTQLIALTQASQVQQSASLIGKAVTVNSSKLSLQNGAAEIKFNTPTAQPVGITVYNSAGTQVASQTLTSKAGSNVWNWDGKGLGGTRLPDGAYSVNVVTTGASGATSKVPFTVVGTATAVQNNSGTVDLQMGGLTLPFSSVVSVGG
jgi:flagellar basal-body rod modification protein FlgD